MDKNFSCKFDGVFTLLVLTAGIYLYFNLSKYLSGFLNFLIIVESVWEMTLSPVQ